MDYVIKVPKINQLSTLSITNSNDEIIGMITIQKNGLKVKEHKTNLTYKVTSSPLKLKNRFTIYLDKEIVSKIHKVKQIIHSLIDHVK